MKLITIHETENTLEAIDELVRQRVFNSRAEVYRTGALLMITVDTARRLAKAKRLDEKLFSNDAKMVRPLIQEGEFEKAQEKLATVEEGLRLKAVLDRVSGKDAGGVETLADGIHRYAKALSRAAEMEPKTRERLLSDLTRDLIALETAGQPKGRKGGVSAKGRTPVLSQAKP